MLEMPDAAYAHGHRPAAELLLDRMPRLRSMNCADSNAT